MKISRNVFLSSAVLLLAASSGLVALAPAQAFVSQTCQEQFCTAWFSPIGTVQTWKPPVNATNLSFEVYGAQGGKNGGLGGKVTGEFTQVPTTFYVAVGSAGKSGNSAAGGFNGGGTAGSGSFVEGSGGGASDIRTGPDIESRIVVAGGGGGNGAGNTLQAGAGGLLVAASGQDGQAKAGGGGSQVAGGAGGLANGSGTSGTSGALFVGGSGGSSVLYGGGGGGGGYYGGGGGGSDSNDCCLDAGGGGGGSSYANSMFTTNIAHTAGNKSGNGLVKIQYTLVPLIQSITAQQTLTNESEINFQIQLNVPFENLSASHVLISGDTEACDAGQLSGSGLILNYTLQNCTDGQVGISIPANSISEPDYSGPEISFSSEIVTIDRSIPEVLEIQNTASELVISLSEPIMTFHDDNLDFSSPSSLCRLGPITTADFQNFIATLLDCDGAGYSVAIAANSIFDAAGNTGPTDLASFSFVLPISETSSASEPALAPRRAAAVTGSSSPQELLQPVQLEQSETVPRAVDSELFQQPERRDQAAQSLTVVSESGQDNASLLGWAIGLGLTGVLILAAGLYIRRRGLPSMLVS
jgi:hypothetical protein